jgi:hypothetical protein
MYARKELRADKSIEIADTVTINQSLEKLPHHSITHHYSKQPHSPVELCQLFFAARASHYPI